MRRATRLGGLATRGQCGHFVVARVSHVLRRSRDSRILASYFPPNYSQTNLALVHLFCDISVVNHQKAKNKKNQLILTSV